MEKVKEKLIKHGYVDSYFDGENLLRLIMKNISIKQLILFKLKEIK